MGSVISLLLSVRQHLYDQAQTTVAVEGQLITVNITQGRGLPAAQVHDAAVALLKLAASKA